MLIVLVLLLLSIIWTYLIDKVSPINSGLHHTLLFLFLWLIMGLRYNVGVDYPTYREMYDDPNAVAWFAVEPIWHYFVKILRWCGFKAQIYFLLTSGFTTLCFYKALSRLSSNFLISVLFLIITGIYFETANTIRQCCAMGTLFWAYSYMLEKRYRPMFGLFVLAFLLHYSAIFGVLLILFSNCKINRFFLLGILLCSVLFGQQLMNLFVNKFIPIIADSSKYNYTVDQFGDGVTSGLLKYLYGAICILIIFAYNKIVGIESSTYRLINMVVYGICVYCIFYTFQPVRRLYMYGFMFIIILIPYLLQVFKPKSRIIIGGILTVSFLLFSLKSSTNPYSIDLSFI